MRERTDRGPLNNSADMPVAAPEGSLTRLEIPNVPNLRHIGFNSFTLRIPLNERIDVICALHDIPTPGRIQYGTMIENPSSGLEQLAYFRPDDNPVETGLKVLNDEKTRAMFIQELFGIAMADVVSEDDIDSAKRKVLKDLRGDLRKLRRREEIDQEAFDSWIEQLKS